MKVIRNALATGIALAAVLGASCSTMHGSIEGPGSNGANGDLTSTRTGGDVGNVGMNLNVFDTTTFTQLTSVDFTCSNGTSSFSGTIAIGQAHSIEHVVGGVRVGSGYTCMLTGMDTAGDFCSGMVAPFAVFAGAITGVFSNITCVVATDAAQAAIISTGSVAIDAGTPISVDQAPFGCPGISSFSISPAEVLPPQTAALAAVSTAGSGGTPTLLWSTDCAGASIASPTSANTAFSCGTELGVTCQVTLTVGLIGTTPDGGSAGQVCAGAPFTSQTASIVCENGTVACPPGQTPCGPDGGQLCVNLATDPNNCGACGNVCPSGDGCGTGTDGGIACVAQPPTACTVAPCATTGPNSVICNGNTAHQNVCTPTEALLVNEDIAQNKLTNGQLNATTSCYECLMNNGGLDDDLVATDKGNECGDVPTPEGGSATLTGETGTQACLDTLSCMIARSCDTASPPSQCFCGTAAGSACLTAGAANGPCLQNELNGLDVTTGCPAGGPGATLGALVECDPTATQTVYTSKTLGSGMANSIGSFAFLNCTSQCGSNL
jgi:hypothetical protein